VTFQIVVSLTDDSGKEKHTQKLKIRVNNVKSSTSQIVDGEMVKISVRKWKIDL
jgi:hypothetical protein